MSEDENAPAPTTNVAPMLRKPKAKGTASDLVEKLKADVAAKKTAKVEKTVSRGAVVKREKKVREPGGTLAVEWEGVTYPSKAELARALGVTPSSIRRPIRAGHTLAEAIAIATGQKVAEGANDNEAPDTTEEEAQLLGTNPDTVITDEEAELERLTAPDPEPVDETKADEA